MRLTRHDTDVIVFFGRVLPIGLNHDTDVMPTLGDEPEAHDDGYDTDVIEKSPAKRGLALTMTDAS